MDGTPALVASGNATGSEVPPQQPTHIRVVLRNGKDDSDDAGEIAEGVYSVERGILVLEDCDGAHIASQPLAITDDPAAVARRLLRETARANFSRPINYPKLGGIA